MNSKSKFLATLALVSGAVLLLGAGCAQKSVSPAPKGEGAPATEVPAKEEANKPAEQASVGKMTDDIYADIVAAMNYSLSKGELKYAGDEGYATLLKEHGVSAADWEAFNKALTANPTRAASLGLKVIERLKAISK